MYLHNARVDTNCGVAKLDTGRIIYRMEHWTDRARRRMKDLEITQDDLRSVFEVKTRGAVGHYLSKRRQPTPEQLHALARRLGCSVDYLLAGHEWKPGSDIATATHDEREVIKGYRQVDRKGKEVIQEIVRRFLVATASHNEVESATNRRNEHRRVKEVIMEPLEDRRSGDDRRQPSTPPPGKTLSKT